MGGNILTLPTRRLEASAYHPLASRLIDELRHIVGSRAEQLRSYSEKEDFGDLDILVDKDALFGLSSDPEDPWEGVLEWGRKNGAVEFVRTNGPSLSFGVPLPDGTCFPVELMATPMEDFQTTSDYYAYNDLGNLIGRVAHKMGMKFGHLGLVYPLREGSHLLAQITVTKDTRAAFDFMGYDYDRWEKGFSSLEDIFNFASSTPYFNPEAFELENLNNRNRTRNRKRKTFMEFLKWLKSGGFQGEGYNFPEDKSVWLPDIRQSFPDFAREMDSVEAKHQEQRQIKAKFNGNLLSEWTGLTGKELGQAMSRLRHELGQAQGIQVLLDKLGDEGFKQHILDLVGSSPHTFITEARTKRRP